MRKITRQEVRQRILDAFDDNVREDFSIAYSRKFNIAASEGVELDLDNPPENIDKLSLVNDLGVDSVDAVNMAMDIEEELELSYPDGDWVQKKDTFGDVVTRVEEYLRLQK